MKNNEFEKSKTSKIKWTNYTWNVTTGIKGAAPGCANCYVMKHSEVGKKGLETKHRLIWDMLFKNNENSNNENQVLLSGRGMG